MKNTILPLFSCFSNQGRSKADLLPFLKHMLSYAKIGGIGKEGSGLQLPFDAYLDIETTGLCSFYDEITVIGICL